MQGPRDQSIVPREYLYFPPERGRESRRPMKFGWREAFHCCRFGLARACDDVVSCFRRLNSARNSVHYNI
jgi:hypothetical protein